MSSSLAALLHKTTLAALLVTPVCAYAAGSSDPIDQAELFYKFPLSTYGEITYDNNIAHPPGPDTHLGVGNTVIHSVVGKLPGLGISKGYGIKSSSDYVFSGPGGSGGGGRSSTFSLSTGVIFVAAQVSINGNLTTTAEALRPPQTSGRSFDYLDALALMTTDLTQAAAPADAVAYLKSVAAEVNGLTNVDDLSLCENGFNGGEPISLNVCYATSAPRDIIVTVTKDGQVVLSGRAHLPRGHGKAAVALAKVVPEVTGGPVAIVATLVPVDGRIDASLAQRKSSAYLELH